MDEVVVEVEKTKREWEDAYEKTIGHILAIRVWKIKERRRGEEKISLQRLNVLAQDGLSLFYSLLFNLDLLVPQLPSDHHVQSTLETWKNRYHSLRVNLTSANLQAKDNMRKAAQEESPPFSDVNDSMYFLETLLYLSLLNPAFQLGFLLKIANAGVTSDAESITESLRRSRQLMFIDLIVHQSRFDFFSPTIKEDKRDSLRNLGSIQRFQIKGNFKMNMDMDKSWITKPRLSQDYIIGVKRFLDFAFSKIKVDMLKCPCQRCCLVKNKLRVDIEGDLMCHGFLSTYTNWYLHGEELDGQEQAVSSDHQLSIDQTGDPILNLLGDVFPSMHTTTPNAASSII
ncbi:Transposase-associated domain [Arabidopsis suecica]|uniref:Transposase-associated domain n=1 Tax=Arabidopsis suecica TaxID=45249 RepID=A0A8T2BDD3_ARASU|nr:Transposase-associated domain [Arabidopsis suecica]